MIGRRALLSSLAGLALTPGVWPGRKAGAAGAPGIERISLIVGARPGSPSDQVARAFAPFLERHLPGTAVEIRNVTGAAGFEACRTVAAAPPDGTVLGWLGTPALPARAVDHGDPGLVDRLRLLGAVQREPIVFVSRAAQPVDNAEALFALTAEGRGGRALATPQAGSPAHLAALQAQTRPDAAVRLAIVAFPTPQAARQAVLAGDAACAALGLADAMPGLRDGSLCGICGTDPSAIGFLAGLPLRYDGALADAPEIRRGLAAPIGLAEAVTARLRDALRDVVADPDFTADAEAAGFVVDGVGAEAWHMIAEEQRAELAGLWRSASWLVAGPA